MKELLAEIEVGGVTISGLQGMGGIGKTALALKLVELGNAFHLLGESRHAIQFYEQQLDIVREIGDRSGEGIALGNLGNAYANLDETRRAI